MVKNLKMPSYLNYVLMKALVMNSHHLLLLSKMELLNTKVEHSKNLPYHFWDEAMNIACYIHNHVTLRANTSSTLYELWKGRKLTVKYFHVFGSKCYILAYRENKEEKLIPKAMREFFLVTLQIEELTWFLNP